MGLDVPIDIPPDIIVVYILLLVALFAYLFTEQYEMFVEAAATECNNGICVTKNPDEVAFSGESNTKVNMRVAAPITRIDGPQGSASIDVAAGAGLTNLTAGSSFDKAKNTYTYDSTRGSSRIQLDDNSVSIYTSDPSKRGSAQPVQWVNNMTLDNSGKTVINGQLCMGNTCVSEPEFRQMIGRPQFFAAGAPSLQSGRPLRSVADLPLSI